MQQIRDWALIFSAFAIGYYFGQWVSDKPEDPDPKDREAKAMPPYMKEVQRPAG